MAVSILDELAGSTSTLEMTIGDLGHALGLLVLLVYLAVRKNAKGISGRTQLLYGVLYTLRYMDLWLSLEFISVYNTSMKVYLICASFLIVHLVHSTFRESYDEDNDNFPLSYLIAPVTVLAFLIHHNSSFQEICWTWSIYMEVVALVPQFHLSWKSAKIPWPVFAYLLLAAAYRASHVPRWIERYNTWQFDIILVVGGVLEITVNVIGFGAMFLVKFREVAAGRKPLPSIYTLPHVVQQVGKDYKLLGSKFNGGGGDDDEDLYVRISKADVRRLTPSSAKSGKGGSTSRSTVATPVTPMILHSVDLSSPPLLEDGKMHDDEKA